MVREVKAEQVKKWIDSASEVIIVDARAGEDYAWNHLPGAVSLLNMEVDQRAEELLPRGVPLVVYSNDADCPASGLVAGKLDRMGFGPVYDYNDSYEDWVLRGYPLEKGNRNAGRSTQG